MRTIITLLTLFAFNIPFRSNAQIFVPTPTESLPTYEIYREELLRKGWLPVRQEFGSNELPEVQCGVSERLCTAAWRYSQPVENRDRIFVLWGSNRGLVVAPAVE